MTAEHVPTAGAHPAHTLVVACADHPLGDQAEDDGGHSVLVGCRRQTEGQCPSGQRDLQKHLPTLGESRGSTSSVQHDTGDARQSASPHAHHALGSLT